MGGISRKIKRRERRRRSCRRSQEEEPVRRRVLRMRRRERVRGQEMKRQRNLRSGGCGRNQL